MALFDNIPIVGEALSGGNWVTGLAIGVGALVVLPLAAPILRPLSKSAIKGGILAYQGAAGLFEGIGDLVAEVTAEGRRGGCHAGSGRGGAGHRDRAVEAWSRLEQQPERDRNPGRGVRHALHE